MSSANDREMSTTFMAVDLDDHGIAWLTVNVNLRFCTRRFTWPVSTRLDARLFVALVGVNGRPRLASSRSKSCAVSTRCTNRQCTGPRARIAIDPLERRSDEGFLSSCDGSVRRQQCEPCLLTAPKRYRMFLALHHTSLKCSHLNSGPWSTIRCLGWTCSADMIRSNAAVTSSDVGRHLNTANRMDRLE